MFRSLRILILFSVGLLLAACAGGPSGPGVSIDNYRGALPQLGDSRPHSWQGGHPYDHPVHGIDISRWQGNIDWNRLRRTGISFAFLKATEGGDHSDPEFQYYWQQARAAGLPRGAYHYYYFCRTGAEQAAWFISHVPRERGTLPPVLDLEWTHSRTCRVRPSPAEIRREAMIFMSALEQYYGQRPIIYTTVDFYRDNNLSSWNEEFWLRSVANHPRITYPGKRWSFWQYTGTGKVPGVSGNVDINVFNGGPQQWRAWLAQRSQR